MNKEEKSQLDFFMSRIKHIRNLRDTEKTKIDIVLYEKTDTTCILRVCKGRNLSAVYESLLKVKNPNIALVYKYIYADGNTYVIEEMLSGTTLDKILKNNGVYSEKETAKIMISVCSGLEALHKLKPPVIHNDITPSNIMICDDNRVKLFDFDISRTYKEGASKNTELFGTEEYASPEHYGFNQSEKRTDIYSLGATMHKMLTGKCLTANKKSIYKGPMNKIIKNCIEIDPENRYKSVKHLKKALEKVLDVKKTIIKIASFLCVVAVIGAGVFLFLNNTPKDEKQVTSHNETIAQTQPSTEITDELIPPTTTESTVTTTESQEEKAIVSKSIDGELISMVVLNDGTMVYLEKINDEYSIKSSSGGETLFPADLTEDVCELVYDPYKDSLYLLTASGNDGNIYHISNSLEFSENPVYTKKQSYTSDIKCMFFSDGLMYCNAFDNDLIDTGNWSDTGSSNCSPIAVANDRIYDFNNNFYMLNELTLDGDCINEYEIPGEILFSRCYFSNKEYLYLTVELDNKNYIYSFDGEKFSEVICLNDYKYYTDFDASTMAINENTLWMYDNKTNTIKEFTI